jgi:hypothetical protein
VLDGQSAFVGVIFLAGEIMILEAGWWSSCVPKKGDTNWKRRVVDLDSCLFMHGYLNYQSHTYGKHFVVGHRLCLAPLASLADISTTRPMLSHPSATLRPARDVWSGTAASP